MKVFVRLCTSLILLIQESFLLSFDKKTPAPIKSGSPLSRSPLIFCCLDFPPGAVLSLRFGRRSVIPARGCSIPRKTPHQNDKGFRQDGNYFELPILNIPVPHTGHLPFIAGLPFFSVTGTAFGSSCFALHFTQYIVAIICFTPFHQNVIRLV